MKIAVTGASGFIGSTFIKALNHENEVYVLGRTQPEAIDSKQFIHIDLLNLDLSDNLFHDLEITHLVHLAWYTAHSLYWSSDKNLLWLDASLKLLQLFCRAPSARKFVGAGTCAEYDWSRNSIHTESDLPNPSTLYGQSKSSLQRLSNLVCQQHGIGYAWGRVFFPYGPGENEKRLVPSLVSAFQGRRGAFPVNLAAKRDLLHVQDMALALSHLLPDNADGIFNLCSGQTNALRDVVEAIASHFDRTPDLIPQSDPVPETEPPVLTGDNSRLKSLGWSQTLSLQEGIAQYVMSRQVENL